jgi:hypothetical protein
VTLRLHRRRWLSGWLIVALLFMQVAASASACARVAVASTQVVAMADMPECEAHRAAQPSALCKAHCEQGTQTVDSTPAAADAPPSPVLWAVLDWSHVAALPLQLAALRHRLPAGAAPPGTPPRYLTLLVLRN